MTKVATGHLSPDDSSVDSEDQGHRAAADDDDENEAPNSKCSHDFRSDCSLTVTYL